MSSSDRAEGGTGQSPGLLIAFEGIDGTGKSTQIRLLAEKLNSRGLPVITTREPTDGQYGRRIRELFHHRERLSPDQELALFQADRREHVETLIRPALAQGRVVLTDRYYFSTAAYQGAAGCDPLRIIAENELFAPGPDLVIMLELPVAAGLHRVQALRGEVPNDFEQEESLLKVARLFAGFTGSRIRRIDGAGTIEAVHALIMEQVEGLLAGWGRERMKPDPRDEEKAHGRN